MVQRKRQIQYDLRGVIVIETDGEAVEETEMQSSSRLRKAEPVGNEFEELRAWRVRAERARRSA
jgi:hypothetical protein